MKASFNIGSGFCLLNVILILFALQGSNFKHAFTKWHSLQGFLVRTDVFPAMISQNGNRLYVCCEKKNKKKNKNSHVTNIRGLFT